MSSLIGGGPTVRSIGALAVPLFSSILVVSPITLPSDMSQLGPVLVLLGILANIAWGTIQRRWIEADRRHEATALEARRAEEAKRVAARLEERADDMRAALEDRHRALEAKLHRVSREVGLNTRLTRRGIGRADKAYKEANGVNGKIAALGLARQIDSAIKTGENTNDRVQDLQHGVEEIHQQLDVDPPIAA